VTTAAPILETPARHAPGPTTCDLSIVVVSWNTRDLLRDCLASVQARLGPLDAEVIVVDNASGDDTAEMVRREFPTVHLVANADNRGFAAANNQGLAIARGRYVLLLNPDTVVLDDVLAGAVEHADRHPDVAVVGCQVMESETALQRTCFRFPSPWHTFLYATGLARLRPRSRLAGREWYGDWDRATARDVDVVSGMFMLVRRSAIDEVGPMDESYFVYAEETDWCYRFRRAGWRCAFAPVGRILHVHGGGQSTGQVSVRMTVQLQRSLLIFHRKHLGRAAWAATKCLFVVAMASRAVGWSLRSAIARGAGAKARARAGARCAAAALRHHLTGREPDS
jgi:GT2 family glycosyltransferase